MMIVFLLKMTHEIDPTLDAGIKPTEEDKEEFI